MKYSIYETFTNRTLRIINTSSAVAFHTLSQRGAHVFSILFSFSQLLFDSSEIAKRRMGLEQLIDELDLRVRLLQAMQEGSLQPGDLTAREMLLLELLQRHGEMTITQISSRCVGAATSTISMTVTKLWRAGLVSKVRDPENQRVTRVALTAKGQEALAKGKEKRRERYNAFIKALDVNDEEYTVLVSLLSRAVAHLDMVLTSSEEGRPNT